MIATRAEALLAELVAFPTISAESNLDLIALVRARLSEHGVSSELVPDVSGRKASLLARVGPDGSDGIVLSGHSDVVPASGQDWSSDPFRLTERGGLLYGRGTADMKGFVACAIEAMIAASARPLARPLHLALSYDEEIGCVGVRSMLEGLAERNFAARFVVVGEPTSMRLALGHKGKLAARATFTGVAGHSAMAPMALNAIHLAADFIQALRAEQARLDAEGARDEAYAVATSTVHAGRMNGGVALNIVPEKATVEFEIRAVGGEDPVEILASVERAAEEIVARERSRFPSAGYEISVTNAYPGLDEPPSSAAAREVSALLAQPDPCKVAFGTEAGLFAARLGLSAVICGPGSMDEGHRPDEFVSRAQLLACDAFLSRLTATLEA